MSLRWVLDSEKYNEWMNPIDYETEEALAEQERLGLVIGSPKGGAWCSSPCPMPALCCMAGATMAGRCRACLPAPMHPPAWLNWVMRHYSFD